MTLREVPDGHVFFFLASDDPDSTPPLYVRAGGVIMEVPEGEHMVTITGKETHAIPLAARILGLEVMDVSVVLMAIILINLKTA